MEIGLSPPVCGVERCAANFASHPAKLAHALRDIAIQQERQRIAMDLHDGTIQSIYAVGLGLEIAAREIAGEPDAAAHRVNAAIDQLNAAIRDIRAYIFDLRPAESTGNLMEDLLATIEDFRATSALSVSVNLRRTMQPVRDDRAAAMLHIAREALSNVRRHARATNVAVLLAESGGKVTLEISDNGVGFPASIEPGQMHRGVRNMRERARRLGGRCDIEAAPGRGTTLRVCVPADGRAAAPVREEPSIARLARTASPVSARGRQGYRGDIGKAA